MDFRQVQPRLEFPCRSWSSWKAYVSTMTSRKTMLCKLFKHKYFKFDQPISVVRLRPEILWKTWQPWKTQEIKTLLFRKFMIPMILQRLVQTRFDIV